MGGSGTPIEETSGNAAPQSSASAPVSTGGTSSAGGDSGGFQGSGSSSSFDDSSSTQGYSGDFQGSGSSSSFDGPSSSTEGYPQSSGDASGSAPLSGFNGAGASIVPPLRQALLEEHQIRISSAMQVTRRLLPHRILGAPPTANGDATMHVKEKSAVQ